MKKENILEKLYVFSGESSGELYRSTSLLDVYNTAKDIKEFDRQNYIQDNYYFEVECLTDEVNDNGHKVVYTYDVKIYKRHGKVYCKYI